MLTLVKALREQGHDAIIVSLQSYTVYDLDENIPVYYLYKEKRKKLYKTSQRQSHANAFTQLINSIVESRGAIDHIFANLDETNYVLAATEFDNVSYIIHNAVKETLNRALGMGPFKYFRQRKLFKALHGKRLIAVSESLKQELQSVGVFTPSSAQCINNPFDINAIKNLSCKPIDNLPESPYMIHIGRLARQKRHDILFEALSLMPDDYRLVCLADNTEKLTALADKFGVASKLITPGFQQNPYAWIKNAKCLVLSSDYEGLPTVIIESLICGTPVVSTDCQHGPEEILAPLPNPYLVPRRAPNVFANKVIECWQNSEQNSEFDKYIERYSHEYIAGKYVKFVETQQSTD